MNDWDDEFRKALERSRLTAIGLYAEQHRLNPNDIDTQMGKYDAESGTIEWFCWQRGSWHESAYGKLNL